MYVTPSPQICHYPWFARRYVLDVLNCWLLFHIHINSNLNGYRSVPGAEWEWLLVLAVYACTMVSNITNNYSMLSVSVPLCWTWKHKGAFIKVTNWFWQVCFKQFSRLAWIQVWIHQWWLLQCNSSSFFPLSIYQVKGLAHIYLFYFAILVHTAPIFTFIAHICVQ